MMKLVEKIHRKIRKGLIKKTTRVFYPFSFDEAKKMALSDFDGFDTDYRWEAETKETMGKFRQWIVQDAKILDFGIGGGRLSKEILMELPSVEVYGVDASKRMLAYCKKYIPKEYHARLHLLHFDKIALIEDSSIDFAFTLHALQHVLPSQLQKAIQELHRVIKPGGYLYVLNMHKRCTFDDQHIIGYDDGIDILKVIDKYFKEKEEVPHTSDYMKSLLKSYFSKLFVKR